MRQIGLAIIGSTGIIGRVHIDAMRGLESCRLVGINARRQEPLKQQADELGTRLFPTLDDVLGDDEVDAIVIATPHPSHLEITTRAAAAVKHVLAEKPLGVTPSEAEAQITACRDAGVKLGVLFNNRFRPEAAKMRQLLDDGAIGEIYRSEMSSAMLRSQDYYDRLDWRGRWDAEGGGALLNQGIHGIDMYQWLAGLPETVFGMVSTLKHESKLKTTRPGCWATRAVGTGLFIAALRRRQISSDWRCGASAARSSWRTGASRSARLKRRCSSS